MISRLKFALGFRHLQVALIFLSMTLTIANKFIISVCMVAMTTINNPNPDFPTYDWDSQQRSYVMSSFMWGYAFSLVGGYLSHRYGTKLVIGIATVFASAMLLLIPLAISWAGWQIFVGLRVLQGLAQGMVAASWLQHLAQWCSAKERTALVGFTFTGIDVGCLLITAVSGVIVSSSLGWPGVWYICGGMYLLWSVFWFIFASSNPSQSPWISAKERSYITASLQTDAEFHKQKIAIPWKALLSSRPVLALVATRCLCNFSTGLLALFMPAFKNGILKLNIENTAFYSSLSYLTSCIFGWLSTTLLEFVLRRQWLTLILMRKVLVGFSVTVGCLSLLAMCLLNQTQQTAILTINIVGFSALTIADLNVYGNALELTQNHAGIVYGIGMTLATSLSMLAPLFVGVVVQDETNIKQWQIVFAFIAALLILAALIFTIWGSSTLQPWDDEHFSKKTKVVNINN